MFFKIYPELNFQTGQLNHIENAGCSSGGWRRHLRLEDSSGLFFPSLKTMFIAYNKSRQLDIANTTRYVLSLTIRGYLYSHNLRSSIKPFVNGILFQTSPINSFKQQTLKNITKRDFFSLISLCILDLFPAIKDTKRFFEAFPTTFFFPQILIVVYIQSVDSEKNLCSNS